MAWVIKINIHVEFHLFYSTRDLNGRRATGANPSKGTPW